MSRMTHLDGELWVGGGLDRSLPRFGRSPEAGYPPYNIELLASGEGRPEAVRITLAVAGFRLDELAITVGDGQLIVRGQQAEERDRDFLYRGIATRRFKRSFGFANGVEVRQAELHKGLLVIELERPRNDARVRTVGIVSGDKTAMTFRAQGSKRATVSDAE